MQMAVGGKVETLNGLLVNFSIIYMQSGLPLMWNIWLRKSLQKENVFFSMWNNVLLIISAFLTDELLMICLHLASLHGLVSA